MKKWVVSLLVYFTFAIFALQVIQLKKNSQVSCWHHIEFCEETKRHG